MTRYDGRVRSLDARGSASNLSRGKRYCRDEASEARRCGARSQPLSPVAEDDVKQALEIVGRVEGDANLAFVLGAEVKADVGLEAPAQLVFNAGDLRRAFRLRRAASGERPAVSRLENSIVPESSTMRPGMNLSVAGLGVASV